MKNEKGYALVLVLLIITITFTFAISLSGMALSARKQFNKTDEINRATDLAEMGVAHYDALLNNFVKEALSETEDAIQKAEEEAKNKNHAPPIPDFDQLFKSTMVSKASGVGKIVKNIKESNTYQVDLTGISGKTQSGALIVAFMSTGSTENESKTITGSITILKQRQSQFSAGAKAPLPQEFDQIISTPLTLNKARTYGTSTYFAEEITWNGGNNKPFIVSGSAFFNDKLTINGSSRIKILGDAIFKVKLSEKEKSYSFCISGTPYLVDQEGNLEVYENFPAGRAETCQLSENGQWAIDPDEGVKVQY
ncbi:hypothetical protein [Mesobacillus selenatarsenatis]|uniref:Uncharacterized protein n=1 Tax=Mesobacillus selenatarsenatis (strain DSM 18680 / JCM 14380 / FERM P-15431 / SF-1) TaxID=1321606 RepID=A0A0A8WWN8_MESS1|nr:hypothetical protein [Mesobacillus selenatarsenatis]GAM12075.1 hypothetical protein SAMD00020551_0194 [Mesobacillus selenatarsenatis SF-1]